MAKLMFDCYFSKQYGVIRGFPAIFCHEVPPRNLFLRVRILYLRHIQIQCMHLKKTSFYGISTPIKCVAIEYN